MSYLPIAATLARTATERAHRAEPTPRPPRIRRAAAHSLRRAAERLEPETSRA